MLLGEILRTLDFSEDGIILAEEPWSASSSAVVREFPADLPLAEMTDEGRTYFLEVSVAREFLEDLKSSGLIEGDALNERVIRYAIDDA